MPNHTFFYFEKDFLKNVNSRNFSKQLFFEDKFYHFFGLRNDGERHFGYFEGSAIQFSPQDILTSMGLRYVYESIVSFAT